MDDREKFFLDQKIRLNTEIIKILAVIEFATITGVMSLILATNPLSTQIDVFLLVFGSISIVVLLNLLILLYRDNVKLINNAKRNDR
jgi:Na+/pantothenate symporter